MVTIEEMNAGGQIPQQPQTPTPGAAGAATGAADPGITVPSIGDLLFTVTALSSISSAGKEYFNTIKKELSAPEHLKHMPFNFITLANPQDTLAIECNKKVILMIPSEVVRDRGENVPIASVYNTAVDGFYAKVNDDYSYRILEIIMVTPEDYPLVETMARGLLNIFQVQLDGRFQKFNIESMKQDQFSISTNPEDIRSFMEQIYPHKAIPRDDIGFVLYRTVPNKDIRNVYRGIDSTPIREPFACVTGYVEVVPVPAPGAIGQPMMNRFQPMVHISSIQSILPDVKITSMLIPLAASVFIRGGLWRTQFEHYRKDYMNLGSLFRVGNDNMPDFADTKNKVHDYLNRFFNAPSLAIDIVDGLFRIPGIEKFAQVEHAKEVATMFYNFINEPVGAEINTLFFENKYREYTGTVIREGMLTDSRWCDYLTTMVHHDSEINAVSGMLSRYNDPKMRVEQIKKWWSDFRILFDNLVCGVSLRAIVPIQSKVQQHVLVVFGNLAQGYNSIDLASAIDDAQFFAQHGGYGVGLWGGATTVDFTNPMSYYQAYR